MKEYFKYFQYLSKDSNYYEPIEKVKELDEFHVDISDDKWKVTISKDSVWKFYNRLDKELPVQGWKIHVSTIYAEAEKTLEKVSKILIKLKISFKHLSNKKVLLDVYSKNGNRVASGKFITIYPLESEFIKLLDILYEELKDLKNGPYVLTDKQWKDSNVYFRYGAFQKILSESGEMCIYDLNGNLVPDLRKPFYSLPNFIKEPEYIQSVEEKRKTNKSNKNNKLSEYSIEKAIRFSNSGGIYSAIRLVDNKRCIIKEARREVGLDGNLRTATERLENEYNRLLQLKDVKGIVKVIDYFKVWEHVFLVEEYVEGETLAKWIARNYPFSPKDNLNEYLEHIKTILINIKEIIDKIHKCDVAMCDLQTQNIILDNNYNVTLIDFEISTSCENSEGVGMETKGFSHPLNKLAKDKDWYSLNRILHYCVLPIGPITDLVSDMHVKQCEWIFENFGYEFYEFYLKNQKEISGQLKNQKEIFGDLYDKKYTGKIEDKEYDLKAIIAKLRCGLLYNCNKERDSLINGDIRQYELNCGKYNLLTGGFGAVWALNKTGYVPEDVNEWVKEKISIIMKGDYNSGLLTGKTGIALVLYRLGYVSEAIKIIKMVISNYKVENDISLRSGLAGIGIALISFYTDIEDIYFIENAEKISDIVSNIIEKNMALTLTDWDSIDVGLLDGYSGVSILYILLYKVTKNYKYLKYAKDLISKELKNMEFMPNDQTLQIFDKNKNRFLPYLANGSIGVGVAISLFNLISKQVEFKEELSAIVKTNNFRCCYDAGLLDGAGGFILLNCIADVQGNDLRKDLKRLQLFMVEDEEKILIPGKFSYRFSSDIYSGVSGIMLSLQAVVEKNILSWLPLNI